MKPMFKRIVLIFCVVLSFGAVHAATAPEQSSGLRLHRFFSEHVVLQENAADPVWGRAAPGAQVTVDIAGQAVKTEADSNGRWKVVLQPVGAGGPYTMTVSDGKTTVTAGDVLFGEVWLASGQSNMGWQLEKTTDYENVRKDAAKRNIRYFSVPEKFSATPQDELDGGEWIICGPDNLVGLSAVAYYFACAMYRELGSPIAIIASKWGGTPAQNWTPYNVLESNPLLKVYADELDKSLSGLSDAGKTPEALMDYENQHLKFIQKWKVYSQKKTGDKPVKPAVFRPRLSASLIYNAMINPLFPYKFKGVIWYQGEANADTSTHVLYAELFSSMIRNWRSLWRDDFPFVYAQLAEFASAGKEDAWCNIRDQQRRTLAKVDNAAMVETLGYGDVNNVHFPNKRPVGELMAKAALAKAYQKKDVIWCGPLIRSATRQDGKLVLTFDVIGKGLKGKAPELTGFEISGDGKNFQPATAAIVKDTVVIPAGEQIRYVRYGWNVNPVSSLFNDEGLPASPFRVEVGE